MDRKTVDGISNVCGCLGGNAHTSPYAGTRVRIPVKAKSEKEMEGRIFISFLFWKSAMPSLYGFPSNLLKVLAIWNRIAPNFQKGRVWLTANMSLVNKPGYWTNNQTPREPGYDFD